MRVTSDLDSWSEMKHDGDGYSVYCKRGKKGGVMEDRYAVVLGLQGDSKQAFFGVFDGHGGAEAAEFAAKHLEKNVMNEVLSKASDKKIEEAVTEGYLATDSEFLKKDTKGGTCCVTALIHKGDLVVSNVGDCRAVMSLGGVAETLTADHRPSLLYERKRIQNLGGYLDCSHGVWRVHGSLAVSRAIGDGHLKEWVIAKPETKVGNQEAVNIVRPLCVGVDKPEASFACKKLVDLSLIRGSRDDISIIVVQLAQFVP
ncbi:probable protein phosphatase 2c 25 [Phtheirospermum japonicum]|uniref:protein-serine/threonine phosphatase n=1 Tax=Phtheirospermum japonicum TaxID=374723 RepID=A0A830BK49_9LAMI|nr:probable protein phosphatase 2c 25 [Phtheirospermum japonicum]